MAGRFLSEEIFAINLVHPAFVRGARLKPTLIGKILESTGEIISIDTVVKPGPALYAMFFGTPVLVIFYCWEFLLTGSMGFLIYTLLLLLLGPPLSLSFYHVAKIAIRLRYMKYIDNALVKL